MATKTKKAGSSTSSKKSSSSKSRSRSSSSSKPKDVTRIEVKDSGTDGVTVAFNGTAFRFNGGVLKQLDTVVRAGVTNVHDNTADVPAVVVVPDRFL